MCPPEHFAVEYAINPWMHTDEPVDTALAVKQWEALRETLVRLGHTVHVLTPEPGLPDMVFAANGALVVDGTAYGARFKHEQRAAEAGRHRAFYEAQGWRFVAPSRTNEGEGDFAYLPRAYGGIILAGYGFRTEPVAHAEAQEMLNHPVVSLRLVDPRFYHLDTALAALDDERVTYFPGAFSAASQKVLAQLFPDAVLADEVDAFAFGLNLVSDGRNVVLNSEATGMAAKIATAGYEAVPVDLSELKKGGGSVKCCVAELRH
ncbi:dimethylargininase [Plantactinospora sp. KBS50]|uniref:dimethylargininase n=1 Tax=Plantactinospora sp. KBS50 TaxID=2024580 RepID=UPI000BAAF6E7|nr:dimethylargininase [Plantactinospora sp. KBS50]ASW57259.1 amidinotransferase [Plantactinospora sp. KBS50]